MSKPLFLRLATAFMAFFLAILCASVAYSQALTRDATTLTASLVRPGCAKPYEGGHKEW